MHVEALGELVDFRNDADTVFSLYEGTVTAFDADTIMSEFLV